MRKIKYRIRDSVHKEFIINDNSFTLLQDGRIKERYKNINWWAINENYIPSLFTWILDKHWKEIYEWDIVRVLYTDRPSKSEDDKRTLDEYMNHLSNIWTVTWSEYKYVIELSFWEKSILPWTHWWIEVIWNIYSNTYHYEVITNKWVINYDWKYE